MVAADYLSEKALYSSNVTSFFVITSFINNYLVVVGPFFISIVSELNID